MQTHRNVKGERILMGTLHQRYKTFWTPEYWQQWREAENPYRRYKSERDRQLALELLALQDGERVLEIGCGYGWVSQALVASAQIQWVGVDLSSAMVRACEKNLLNGSGTVADVLSLPFGMAVFDAVLCSGVLMHVEDDVRALVEMVRVLRPGGRLVISGNNLFSPFALPSLLWNLSKRDYKQSFRPSWFYTQWLRRLGLQVGRVTGDTLLAVTMPLPGRTGSVPPQQWFKTITGLDRWMETPLRYFAYELWFLAIKQTQGDSTDQIAHPLQL